MEQEILTLLQQTPGVLYSAKEVSRRIDRDRYRTEASWARPHLKALVEQHLIEEDESGYFFYPRETGRDPD